ncbi:L-serine dehydratase [Xylophilus ampelinus]|nr:L-serine dehydratase [Xylophilus ampelinus]
MVTAPTNGAAGVVPAVLHYYVTFVPGASEAGVVDFLLTAAAIGMLYFTQRIGSALAKPTANAHERISDSLLQLAGRLEACATALAHVFDVRGVGPFTAIEVRLAANGTRKFDDPAI